MWPGQALSIEGLPPVTWQDTPAVSKTLADLGLIIVSAGFTWPVPHENTIGQSHLDLATTLISRSTSGDIPRPNHEVEPPWLHVSPLFPYIFFPAQYWTGARM